MSVLIKNIKMPKFCRKCPCVQSNPLGNGHFCTADHFVRDVNIKNAPPDWCPLVEIPTPHGPLIDRAELLSAKFAGISYDPIMSDGVEKTDKEVYAYRVGWNEALIAAYLNAPIVIDAEEKEK